MRHTPHGSTCHLTLGAAALIALLATPTVTPAAAQRATTNQAKQQVVALLKAIETGDSAPVSVINPTTYIQHNLGAEDGLAGFWKLLQALPKGSAKVNTVRVFQDGPFVFAHTQYDFFGPKVGFDIFRFEGGKIVEHWDNLQERAAAPNASGHTQSDGPTVATELANTAANKRITRSFYEDVLINGRAEKVAAYFDGDRYIQHSPGLGDGAAFFTRVAAMVASGQSPLRIERIHTVLGEGSFVLIVAEGVFRGKPSAFYDLFRLENGKIAEHWDAIEAIPPRSEWKNQNGKFGFLALPTAAAQPPVGPGPSLLPGPAPTHRDLAYARSDASTGQGHLLDLYLPAATTTPVPVVIFTHGSGWMADNGRMNAQALAAVLNPKGYAVAGVAVRSSAQTQFPGQLHDIKAAIRWLRANAATYRLDPAHVGIIGESSGGWTAAMAAVTSDVPELEGSEGTTGASSAVQAAIAFYPPTDFLQMDAWALAPCDPAATLGPPTPGAPRRGPLCHSSATSPESRLIGCALPSCPDKVQAANPVRYISRADPPMMIVHGESDPLVPHAQGELLYQALNKACHDAVFISLPTAAHGVWYRAWTDPALAAGATRRSTTSAGCAVELPTPFTPSWATVVEFLDRYLKQPR